MGEANRKRPRGLHKWAARAFDREGSDIQRAPQTITRLGGINLSVRDDFLTLDFPTMKTTRAATFAWFRGYNNVDNGSAPRSYEHALSIIQTF